MPAGKRPQTNTMLITLITFVGLFIVTSSAAIIFYVKFEDQRTKTDDAESQLSEMASRKEWTARAKIVGSKGNRETYLGKMVEYLDQITGLVIGGPLEETSAEIKVKDVNRKVTEALTLLSGQYINIDAIDPNTTGLVRIIETLKIQLDTLTNAKLATEQQLNNLQNQFNDAMAASRENEQLLLAEKEEYRRQVINIKRDYNDLEALLEQTSEESVQALMAQLSEERANYEQEHQEKLQIQAQLEMTQDRMKRQEDELRKIVPLPDGEVVAHKSDGKIILVDNPVKVVHLNIGRDDRVYPGLTFSVYDKNMPIPKDGKGKAEIEVFSVEKNISAARIIKSEIKRPIILDDIGANLIWDRDKTNAFVIEGDFDLDGDGKIDKDAADKIKSLIGKWAAKWPMPFLSRRTSWFLVARRAFS